MSGGDSQQRPPPPPPPTTPSGSPFGRFLTSPVLLIAVLALVVSFATLRYIGGDGGGATAPVPSGIEGRWRGAVASARGDAADVRLELTRTGGTLTRSGCSGTLTPRTSGETESVYDYAGTSGGRRCPRRTRVTVSLVDPDTLRIDERRRGRPYLSGTLRRR